MKYAAALTLIPLVAAHGFVRSPPPRKPGEAFKAACGEQPFYQQSSDINGNVQGVMQVADIKPQDCNLWLCKGFQFEDNSDNVHSFQAGQTIDFDVNIAAPHTGFANVSVVNTANDKVIGVPLIEFDEYASNNGIPANNTAFSVTLPNDLSDCTEAGACVLQWFWDAPDIDQTYESCIDFTVGGSAGGDSPDTPAPTVTAGGSEPTAEPSECPDVDDEEADEDEDEDEDVEDEEPVDDCSGEDDEEEPIEDECPAEDVQGRDVDEDEDEYDDYEEEY